MLVKYNTTEDPEQTATGVYACRVPLNDIPGLYKDEFLMWYGARWSYLGSDQNYRGEVTGWIGPLQRRMN